MVKSRSLGYVADFETLTTEPTTVWAYSIVEVGSTDVFYGNTIEEFFEECKYLLKSRNSINVFFHNLKFDGSFILNYLLRNGYKHVDKLNNVREFTTLITDKGIFFGIDVCISKRGSRKRRILFKDSLKLLPMSVEGISVAFGLDYKKLEIDYNEYRSFDHIFTQEEIDYISNDVIIVSQGLKHMFELGLTKTTIAGNALGWFKDMLPTDFVNIYPKLPYDVDQYLRRSYKGGFTYVNPKFKNKVVGKGIVLDVNSLYPSVMYNEFLPIGEPKFFVGRYQNDDDYPLYICRFRCQFELKKDYIPTLQLKGNYRYNETEYITSSNYEFETITMTSVDFELFKSHYNVYNIEYIDGFKFAQNNTNFRGYIDYWTDVKINAKREGNKPLYQISKFMLNSLYGKFGMNPESYKKIPYLSDDEILKFKESELELRDPIYVALASFVTSYARKKTIETSQKVYDRYLYSDTDSIHMLGSIDDLPDNIDIDDYKLGYWSLDDNFNKAKYLRTKTYVYNSLISNKLVIKIAGMPASVKEYVDFENFHTGMKFDYDEGDVLIDEDDAKLRFKQVKGGVILVPTPFTLK